MGEELRLPGAGTGETGAWRGQALGQRDSLGSAEPRVSRDEGRGAVPKVP